MGMQGTFVDGVNRLRCGFYLLLLWLSEPVVIFAAWQARIEQPGAILLTSYIYDKIKKITFLQNCWNEDKPNVQGGRLAL